MDLLLGQGGKGRAGANGAAALVKESNTQAFVADVIEASMEVPVIVVFWSPRAPGQAQQVDPVLEKLVREARGTVRLVKVNIEQNRPLVEQLRIQSVPTVYAFKGGRPVDGFVGAVPESQVKAFIQRLTGGRMGGGLDEVLAEARELLAAGDVPAAAQLYQAVLQQAPDNAPAMAGLIRCMLAGGDVAGARRALAGLPAEMAKHGEIGAARSAVELAEQAGKAAGQTAELRRRLALDPADHQARYDLAMAYYASGEREAAVEELLDLFRRERGWNDEAARKQLVKLFEAFGPTDPLTLAARRRLSSLMFS